MAKIKYEAPVITDMDSRLLFNGDIAGEQGKTSIMSTDDPNSGWLKP